MNKQNNVETKYDNNKIIYTKNLNTGIEEFIDRNKNGRIVHVKRSNGFEKWIDRTKQGRITHIKYSTGVEIWFNADGSIKRKRINSI